MTDENKVFSAENENPESEVCIYRHEVLRKLFACSSGKTSAAFSLISFVNGFSLFAYELLVLAVGLMGTMGFARCRRCLQRCNTKAKLAINIDKAYEYSKI